MGTDKTVPDYTRGSNKVRNFWVMKKEGKLTIKLFSEPYNQQCKRVDEYLTLRDTIVLDETSKIYLKKESCWTWAGLRGETTWLTLEGNRIEPKGAITMQFRVSAQAQCAKGKFRWKNVFHAFKAQTQ